MIKLSRGFSKESQAYEIILIFSETNLTRMRDQQQPVIVYGTLLDLPDPGADFVFMATKDLTGVTNLYKEFLEGVKAPSDFKATVIHMQEPNNWFYVLPFPQENDRLLYVMAFDGISYALLRDGNPLQFRSRRAAGNVTPVHVTMLWDRHEVDAVARLSRMGLIQEQTKLKNS